MRYQYKCGRCGHPFEADRSPKESGNPIRCPKCPGMSRRDFSHAPYYFVKGLAKDRFNENKN